MMSQDKSQALVTSKTSWREGTEGAGAQGYGGGLGAAGRLEPQCLAPGWQLDRGAGTHLGHVLGDDVEPTFLLYDHAQKLYQVAMPKLPGAGRGGQSLPSLPITSWPRVTSPPPALTHVMTEASARKAWAVASFLMHLTATLFPR